MLLLAFCAAQQPCALPAASVRHVLPYVRPVGGHITWRGERLPLLDVCLLLGGEPAPAHYSTRVLVCDGFALLVALATDTLDAPEILPPPQGTPLWVSGAVQTQGRTWWVLCEQTLAGEAAAHA